MLVVDDREITQHPEIPSLLEPLPIHVARMEAADYSFLDRDIKPLGIERSKISNLIQKLRSGELEDQMYKCQENYNTVILLIEDVYDKANGFLATHRLSTNGYYRNHVYPYTRYSDTMAMIIRLSEMGIEIIHSPNLDCSMDVVRATYYQRTKPDDEHQLFRRIRPIKLPVKLSSNPAVPKLMGLTNRFPEKVAVRLINKYDTIWNVLHAEDEELLAIEGMGRGLLSNLKRGVGKA